MSDLDYINKMFGALGQPVAKADLQNNMPPPYYAADIETALATGNGALTAICDSHRTGGGVDMITWTDTTDKNGDFYSTGIYKGYQDTIFTIEKHADGHYVLWRDSVTEVADCEGKGELWAREYAKEHAEAELVAMAEQADDSGYFGD